MIECNGGSDKNEMWHKGSRGVRTEDYARTSENIHTAEKARDTALDDEKMTCLTLDNDTYDVHFSDGAL